MSRHKGINLKVPQEQAEALDREALKRKVPRTVLIREAIAHEIGAEATGIRQISRRGMRKKHVQN